MPVTPSEILRLAAMARLSLSRAEVEALSGELSRILESFDQLRAVEPSPLVAAAPGIGGVLRDDVVRPGLGRERAVAGAPAVRDGLFVVPAVGRGR